jgi:aquaporin Z
MKAYAAEFLGTFWLVLGGCGSAVLAAAFPNVGIGLLGVSLAFGLTVLTMAFAIGHISGCHLNRRIRRLWAGAAFRRTSWRLTSSRRCSVQLPPAACCTSSPAAQTDSTSRRDLLPTATARTRRAAIHLTAALVCEVVMTMFFLIVILGATDERAPAGFAPIAIGLALTLIHLISIPVTNHVGQPGAQHRCRGLRRRLGRRRTLAVLAAPIVGA